MKRQKGERAQAARRATVMSFVSALNGNTFVGLYTACSQALTLCACADTLVAFFLHLLVEPFIVSNQSNVLDERTDHAALLHRVGDGSVQLQTPPVTKKRWMISIVLT